MLRISKKADYAVFLLGAIAREGAYPGGAAEDSVVSAQEIAKQAGLNKSVVANLLKEFARHGVLDSVRGLRGGYRLARPPQQISLGHILEVVEGKFVLVDCVTPANDGAFGSTTTSSGSSSSGTTSSGTSGLLPIAASSQPHTEDAHDCSLIAFCPSKRPMRIVHERISRLFADIHLDELCALTPVSEVSGAAGCSTNGNKSQQTRLSTR